MHTDPAQFRSFTGSAVVTWQSQVADGPWTGPSFGMAAALDRPQDDEKPIMATGGSDGVLDPAHGGTSVADTKDDEPRERAATDEGDGDGDAASSDRDEDQLCRVCRCEAEAERPLYSPCRCDGSVRWVHQDCLSEWLQHAGIDRCELCRTKFEFVSVYAPGAPRVLPAHRLAVGALRFLLHGVPVVLHFAWVFFVWVVVLPVMISLDWRMLMFPSSIVDVPDIVRRLPFDIERFGVEWIAGVVLAAVIFALLVSLSSFEDFVVREMTDLAHLAAGPPPVPPPAADRGPDEAGDGAAHVVADAAQDPDAPRARDDAAGPAAGVAPDAPGAPHDPLPPGVGVQQPLPEDSGADSLIAREFAGRPLGASADAERNEVPIQLGVVGDDDASASDRQALVADEAAVGDATAGIAAAGGAGGAAVADEPGPAAVDDAGQPDPAGEQGAAAGAEPEEGGAVNGDVAAAPAGAGVGAPDEPLVEDDEFADDVGFTEFVGLAGPWYRAAIHAAGAAFFCMVFIACVLTLPTMFGRAVVSIVNGESSAITVMATASGIGGIKPPGVDASPLRMEEAGSVLLGHVAIAVGVSFGALVNTLVERATGFSVVAHLPSYDSKLAVYKIAVLLFLKLGVVPLIAGWLLDVATLDLAGATLDQRLAYASEHGASSLWTHWLAGITFILIATGLVLQLRAALHPSILAPYIRAHDPNQSILRSVMQDSTVAQLKRAVGSLVIFGVVLLLFVYLPSQLLGYFVPSLSGPLPLELYYVHKALQQPLDLAILHLSVMLALESFKSFTWWAQTTWLDLVCGALGVADVLLPEEYIEVAMTPKSEAAAPGAAADAGGGEAGGDAAAPGAAPGAAQPVRQDIVLELEPESDADWAAGDNNEVEGDFDTPPECEHCAALRTAAQEALAAGRREILPSEVLGGADGTRKHRGKARWYVPHGVDLPIRPYDGYGAAKNATAAEQPGEYDKVDDLCHSLRSHREWSRSVHTTIRRRTHNPLDEDYNGDNPELVAAAPAGGGGGAGAAAAAAAVGGDAILAANQGGDRDTSSADVRTAVLLRGSVKSPLSTAWRCALVVLLGWATTSFVTFAAPAVAVLLGRAVLRHSMLPLWATHDPIAAALGLYLLGHLLVTLQEFGCLLLGLAGSWMRQLRLEWLRSVKGVKGFAARIFAQCGVACGLYLWQFAMTVAIDGKLPFRGRITLRRALITVGCAVGTCVVLPLEAGALVLMTNTPVPLSNPVWAPLLEADVWGRAWLTGCCTLFVLFDACLLDLAGEYANLLAGDLPDLIAFGHVRTLWRRYVVPLHTRLCTAVVVVACWCIVIGAPIDRAPTTVQAMAAVSVLPTDTACLNATAFCPAASCDGLDWAEKELAVAEATKAPSWSIVLLVSLVSAITLLGGEMIALMRHIFSWAWHFHARLRDDEYRVGVELRDWAGRGAHT